MTESGNTSKAMPVAVVGVIALIQVVFGFIGKPVTQSQIQTIVSTEVAKSQPMSPHEIETILAKHYISHRSDFAQALKVEFLGRDRDNIRPSDNNKKLVEVLFLLRTINDTVRSARIANEASEKSWRPELHELLRTAKEIEADLAAIKAILKVSAVESEIIGGP